MRKDQKKVYWDIINGFEDNYYKVIVQDNLTDSASLRIAFYESCLSIVRDGPRLKSHTVQYNLIRYYEWRLRKTLEKLTASETES